jgi:cell shape-determining protein MreD
MKNLLFFALLWLLGIFFQSFSDIITSFWKINIIFCITYSVLVLCRSPIYAIYSFFLGLTYDYLSFSTPGIYALTFFLAYYVFYFFNIRKEELFKHFVFSGCLFTGVHLVVVFLNFIYFNENYLGLFFTRTLWIEILPTIILLMGIFPLIKKMIQKFILTNDR